MSHVRGQGVREKVWIKYRLVSMKKIIYLTLIILPCEPLSLCFSLRYMSIYVKNHFKCCLQISQNQYVHNRGLEHLTALEDLKGHLDH